MWYIIPKEKVNELYHYGIKDQKWGVKNGPPYPLDPSKRKSGSNLNASSLPTVRLPKAEYAHVMSEIATNISNEQREQKVFSKYIGNFIYTVENNFDNTYRVIDKSKIR